VRAGIAVVVGEEARNYLLEEVLQAPAGIAVAVGEEARNYLLEEVSGEIVKVEYPAA
jgi:predicted nicotinamide N-methyase